MLETNAFCAGDERVSLWRQTCSALETNAFKTRSLYTMHVIMYSTSVEHSVDKGQRTVNSLLVLVRLLNLIIQVFISCEFDNLQVESIQRVQFLVQCQLE